MRDGLIGNTINDITSISGRTFFFCDNSGISQYTPSDNNGMVNISSVTTPKNEYLFDNDFNEQISTQTDYRIRFSFNAANFTPACKDMVCSFCDDHHGCTPKVGVREVKQASPNKTR